ncbi:MAG: FkbM family methyltransferase [Bryobacteraceae bacterium]|nr:FkbM family methyltransferase [Bryobacteraceae bacterium]
MRLGRIVLALLILLVAGGVAYKHSPRFRLFALAITGHSPVCPLRLAVRSTGNANDTLRIKDRILAASHLRQEESGLELWDTPKGPFWVPKGNRFVLPFNLAEMERQIYGSGEHFIHPGDVVLDCGASDGDFTREALRAGAKLVVSVEISPSSIECIRRNFAGEIADHRVIVYPKGVWDKDDSLMLNVDDTNFAANSVVMKWGSLHAQVKVPLTTIDKLAAELNLPRVDFIKMDVEGAEVPALHGAHDTIQRFKPRLSIATEHKPDDEFTIPSTVRALRPDYQMQCGPCLEANGHVRPDVLYFY